MNLDMSIQELVFQFKNNANFKVHEPSGYPEVKNEHILPDDVEEFYSLCGGIECYENDGGFPIRILSPSEVKLSNLALLGHCYEEDISSSWYIIVDAEDGNYISIDFNYGRLGKCYESFEYTHAIAGNCPVVAVSFTDLLNHIIKYTGDYFYWKANPDFNGYGDAYN